MPGGRARKLEENGYRFDMGPTWYWMPDVFEKFFNKFFPKKEIVNKIIDSSKNMILFIYFNCECKIWQINTCFLKICFV